MRLPVTDKFLWDLYNSIEGIERTYEKIRPPRSMYEGLYRDTIRLRREYERKKMRRTFSQFIHYLQTRGYIRVKALEGTKGIMLTPKGVERALKMRRKLSERRRRKDGKWIMVMFDIPEQKRSSRQILRDALRELGYEKFQQSVWVCPYDTFAETEKMIREYQLIPYVKLFLIEEIT